MFNYKLLHARYVLTEATLGMIGSLAGAAASVAGTGASIGATSQLNKKNRKWQEKMYKLAVENNRQDAETAYGRQNELVEKGSEIAYQNQLRGAREMPSATVQGYKDAGLNLGLALQGGINGTQGGGTSATAPQAAPAQQGAPQTFGPQIFDISAAIKNIADAKLAQTKAKTEEGVQKIQEEQINNIKADTDKKRKEIEEMDSKINLNELAGAWQETQNEIAKDTKKEQKEAIRWNFYNQKKQYELTLAQIKDTNEAAKLKTKLIEYNNAQCELTLSQKFGQDIQNKHDQQTFEDLCKITRETANKIAAEAKNEKEFKERWTKEMDLKNLSTDIQRFAAQNKNIWSSFVGAYNTLWTGDAMKN